MSARTSHAPTRSLGASRLSWLALAAVAALAPALSGCELGIAMMIADDVSNDDEVYYGNDGYYGDDGYYGGSQSALQTKNAEVEGDLGEAIDFSGAANYVDAWDDGYYTSITLWADGSDGSNQWATMTALNIEGGGLSSEVFKPGAKLHFSSEDYNSSPYVYAWGCSGTGSDASMLDYEASGSETDIEVSEAEDPGMVHLAVTITYPGYGANGGQVVHGELDVAVPVAE